MNTRSRTQAVYVISVAAELAGMHPQTLRIYERRGLVLPARTQGGNRRYSDADIERYTALVKETVGFNEARGDTVVVMSDAFRTVAPTGEIEGPPIWEKPIVRDILKQVLGAALVLALLFGVIRPMLRNVMASHAAVAPEMGGGAPALAAAGGTADQSFASGAAALPAPNYDEKVAAAKNITGHDPARVAQVVKQWVSADE